MDAGDLRLVELMINERTAGLAPTFDLEAVRGDVTRLADSIGSLLDMHAPPAVEEVPLEEVAPEAVAETIEVPAAVEEAAEAAEEASEEPAAIELLADGELLEELEVVTALTPAEAQDEIAPLRTHPLLRRVGGARV